LNGCHAGTICSKQGEGWQAVRGDNNVLPELVLGSSLRVQLDGLVLVLV
jgi:hypothetical protein